MKKFIFITNYFPPEGFAASVRAYNYTKYIKKWGFEPIVITGFPSPRFPKDSSLLEDLREIEIYRTKFLSPGSLPIKTLKKGGRELKRDLKPFLHKSFEIINREKISFVFITLPPFSLIKVGLSIKIREKIPLICEIRDPAYFESGKRFKKLIKNSEKMVNLFIGPNEFVLNSFGIKGKIIYPGTIKFKSSSEEFNIIYAGSLKGAEESLKRFLKNTAEINYKLLILGAKSNIKDQRVKFLPYIEYKKLPEYYRRAKLFVIFRDRDCKNYIPLKFFEKSGGNVPIIAYFKEKGKLFYFLKKFKKGEGFVFGEEEKLKKLLKNLEKQRIETPCLNYSWEKRVKELSEIFKDVSWETFI
jgi:hypothetical protein